ncbi:MAG: carbon-nitrogen hydrolase family protein [Hyphomicrobium sp.]|jgi:predicted amidohydrolase
MSLRQTVRIAAAQYPIDQPATLAAWREKIARWVADGAATGAEVLVFPEYAAIEQAAALGERVYSDLDATLQAVADLEPERVGLHQELATKHGVYILVGSGPSRKGEGRYVNVAQLVTPNGAVGVQEKLIMTPFETDWGISAGKQARVFDTALGLIGINICYDSEFPLLARAMAEAGAELLLVPSCTERMSGYHRVRTGSRARALENQIAAVVSPTVGDALWSPAVDHNSGAAGIYVPAEQTISETGVLAQGEVNTAQWVAGTVDLARLRHLRTSGEMRNFIDWPNQAGAAKLADKVEIVTLE